MNATCQQLGLRGGGKQFKSLSIHIERLSLSTLHWDNSGRPPLDLAEICVENSDYKNTTFLAERLVREGVFDYKCNCCGVVEWLGKPLKLHLHHKNGVNNDHRVINLELLCPNCHSQTDTYSGRNRSVA